MSQLLSASIQILERLTLAGVLVSLVHRTPGYWGSQSEAAATRVDLAGKLHLVHLVHLA